MAVASIAPSAADALLEELRLLDVREAAQTDPKALINEIRFFDPSTDSWVEFKMFPPEGWEAPVVWFGDGDFEFLKTGAFDWFWQTLIIDWLHDPAMKKGLLLKARQLGMTLLACAYGLWLMLFQPGSVVAAYSYTEDEAKKLVEAAWMMYLSLPAVLTQHVTVLVPQRAAMPSEFIKLKHADGRISSFQALPATRKHGHGARVTFAIMDEVARQDYARDIYTAINPATSRGNAKLLMISTANGVSNKETGEGNFFHHLYVTKEEKNLSFHFLPWNLEPTRDEAWYAKEAMALDEVERNQQYPLNEADAFMLSGATYFNSEALEFYRNEVRPPLFRGQFTIAGRRSAHFMRTRDGVISIYEPPKPDGVYAIGVDTSTGRGSDFTVGTVIDLSSAAIVATFRGKMESPRVAVQLHFLGKWFNTARIAVERQGGYGEALIYALRDGDDLRPPYSNLYRHTKFTSGNRPISDEYGHPMGPNARGTVLDQLKLMIRNRAFPWMPSTHMDELGTFVYAATTPSPRAQDGCNDDCVMSLALAAEMYRQFGTQPAKRRTFKKAKYDPPPTRRN